MNRSYSFEQRTRDTLHYTAIGLTIAAVYFLDQWTPNGVAIWILYMVPVVMCLITGRSELPLVVGSICGALMVVDYFMSTPLITPWISQANRGIGVLVVVTIAFVARQVINNRNRLRHQEWIRKALTHLAERLRGDHSLSEIGDRTLQLLANHLRAHVGVAYVRSGEELHRIGGFALAQGQENRERLHVSEGLMGEAMAHGYPVIVDDVPADYLQVSSGLGEGKPASLIIVPVMADGESVGAIELGFFRAIVGEDLELLNLMSEPIGIALRTARIREHREELLNETQRQAEELQAQQEELRATNEDLEEQSNALRDSQARLEAQQAELEQTNQQLEQHMQMLTHHNDILEETRRSLNVKAAELVRANQYKSEFLANMSHELRTPLNSALILAKLLADNKAGNLTSEQVRFASNIYSAGNDLLELINEILDLSKIEAGHVDVTVETFDPVELIQTLLQGLQPLAQQKTIELTVHAEEGCPRSIASDPQRLRQILRNLISNALKFTERGSVQVRMFAADDKRLGVAIRDTGIGIDSSQHRVIFEPFRQADGSTHRQYGGTGLGLSISRELAELLGGRIDLESSSGVGSVFTLLIATELSGVRQPQPSLFVPVRDAAMIENSAPSSPPAVVRERRSEAHAEDDRSAITDAGRVLLVIEDDLPFSRILYDLARSLKFHCLLAHSADEGMELALQYRPAAIVLDIKLPDHTGLSVLDRLKHNSVTRHIPVQIVSAFDYAHAALEMGAAGVTIKPADRDQLAEALERLTARSAEGVRSVLVVEDNAMQRESICELLTSEAVRAIPVANAAEALAQLQQHTFDCMVLDLALPDSNGYELLEEMARGETYSFPPVIVYTGRALSADDEQRLRKYSKSIIIKGAKSPERLLDEVTLFLHQVEQNLPLERQRMIQQARNRESPLAGRRILVVEDDVRNIFALSNVLEPCGAQIEIARNGVEALKVLEPQKHGIDLVLMDIMMPQMDGITATRELRKRPSLADLPVIALTAKAMPDDRQRCLDAGANDYVTKPIDVDKLLSLIRIWLQK